MISVIIPSFNRKDILKKAIDCLLEQDFDDFEIIVVENGSKNFVDFAKNLDIKYFQIKEKNVSKARNLGIKKAKGEIIVFIGDDIFVSKNFLSSHDKFHKKNDKKNYACIGETNFADCFQNDFSAWLENSGFQFDFKKLRKTKKASFRHFYTSNISLKKEILEKENFDENFVHYGFEDIELGFRLFKNENLKIIFDSNCKAKHFHKIDKKNFVYRMRKTGLSAVFFEKKHKNAKIIASGIKKFLQIIISKFPNLLYKIKKEWGWYAFGKSAFFKGCDDVD